MEPFCSCSRKNDKESKKQEEKKVATKRKEGRRKSAREERKNEANGKGKYRMFPILFSFAFFSLLREKLKEDMKQKEKGKIKIQKRKERKWKDEQVNLVSLK